MAASCSSGILKTMYRWPMATKSRGCIPGVWSICFQNQTPHPARPKNCRKCTIPRVFPWVSLGSTPGKANDKCIMHGQFHPLTVLSYPCHTQTFIASSFKILIIIGKNLSQSIKVNIHVLVMPCWNTQKKTLTYCFKYMCLHRRSLSFHLLSTCDWLVIFGWLAELHYFLV